MRTLVPCLLLLFSVTLHAQQNLSGSRHNSVYKYAYKITENEALTLYRDGMYMVGEKYLHTLIDSSLTDSVKLPSLQPGNYLLVQAKENKLLYDLITISDLNFKLVNNNRDLVIALHDKSGKLLTDAKVYLRKKRIPYNATTQTFRLPKHKKKGSVYVYYNGVLHYYPLQGDRRPSYAYRSFWYRLSHKAPVKYVTQGAGEICSAAF
jgi:alpha-2-macroglobulin